jgi:chemotaxis protein CheD
MKEILVGIGEYRIDGGVILKTIGLGSCVGVILYEPHKRIGGLAHILLPGSSDNSQHIPKYAEDAIEVMLREFEDRGIWKKRLIAKIAGGAQIFKQTTLDVLKIGEKNVESVKNKLKEEEIKIIAEDVGGWWGRTILFNTENGTVLVKYSNGERKWI